MIPRDSILRTTSSSAAESLTTSSYEQEIPNKKKEAIHPSSCGSIIMKQDTNISCTKSFTLLEELPLALQFQILSFVDVPTLGSCTCVSKGFRDMARSDILWQDHLRFLLKELYEDAVLIVDDNGDSNKKKHDPNTTTTTTSTTPNTSLFDRPLRSTELLQWYQQVVQQDNCTIIKPTLQCLSWTTLERYQQNTNDYPTEIEHHYQWLLQDVSLRDYYQQAGLWAFYGAQTQTIIDDTNQLDDDDDDDLWDHMRTTTTTSSSSSVATTTIMSVRHKRVFAQMPPIRLFRYGITS